MDAWTCFTCDSCLKSIGRLKMLYKKISDKHVGSKECGDVSSFHPHISPTKIFNDVKTQFMSGSVRIGWVEKRKLIYLYRFAYVVGSYSVKIPGRGFKRRETRWVRVVCGTSKCKNPTHQTHLTPKIVISMHPDSPDRKKKTGKELSLKIINPKVRQTGCRASYYRNTMKKRIELM